MTFLVQLFRRLGAVSAGIVLAGTTLAAHAAELTASPDSRALAPAPCAPSPSVATPLVTTPLITTVALAAVTTPVAADLPAACPPDTGVTPPPPNPADDAFTLKATLYVTNARSSGRDSIGCPVVPMRTVAVDGHVVARHTVLFIKETVGLRMPDGSAHDGYWYATDTGSAIHAGRIDLYTGKGVATIQPLIHLNLKDLTVRRAGTFTGCPDPSGRGPQAGTIAANSRSTSTVAKQV